jgi:ribosomal protein S18 acetylase RimI-like enzyme
MARLTTKELSKRTWADLEKLYSQPGNGWNFCWYMICQRGRQLPRGQFPNRAAQAVQNRLEKKALVDQGRSHGILVYSGREPVGWCQFGPKNELPLADDASEGAWRITCFVTHKDFRRQGVASVALRAAVAAIAKRGGGVIEGFPLSVDGTWSYTGTVELFEREGFTEVSRALVPETDFPHYDRNRNTAALSVVVMQRTV